MSKVIVTPPASYPVSLAEAKAQLRETSTDNDTYITALIAAATDEAENYVWRRFVTQTWRLYCQFFGEIKIPYGSLQSVTSVKYYDSDDVQQTLAATTYQVDINREPPIIRLAYGKSWPSIYSRDDAIEVEFVCGYTTVPESIKYAILMKIELLYGNLEAGEYRHYQRAYADLLQPYTLMDFI